MKKMKIFIEKIKVLGYNMYVKEIPLEKRFYHGKKSRNRIQRHSLSHHPRG